MMLFVYDHISLAFRSVRQPVVARLMRIQADEPLLSSLQAAAWGSSTWALATQTWPQALAASGLVGSQGPWQRILAELPRVGAVAALCSARRWREAMAVPVTRALELLRHNAGIVANGGQRWETCRSLLTVPRS